MTNPANMPPMDAGALASEIVRRDRTRVRVLATLTVLLWVVAGALIPAIFLPLGAEAFKTIDGLDRRVATGEPLAAADLLGTLGPVMKYTLKVTLISFFMAILAAIGASITTIALALTIRRSTLRQVSANLATISEQLRQIRPS